MCVFPEIESKTLEFKLKTEGKYERAIKTLIAFANTKGGKIIIGVQDKTRKVMGIAEGARKQIMEDLPNALYDAVAPPLAVNCYEQNLEGKMVLLVQVYPGPNQPYYLKREGYPDGVYIRNGAHTRRADQTVIDEFELKKKRRLFEDLLTEAEIEELEIPVGLSGLKAFSKERMLAEQAAGVDSRNELRPTIAGTLLFHPFPHKFIKEAYMMCSRFSGNNTRSLEETSQITGPLWAQIDNAGAWVLSRLESGRKLKGMKREVLYRAPQEAIREAIINAAAHRNYQRMAPVRIMVFKNRLEVISPGGFTAPIDNANLLEGLSQFRNPAVSRILHKMKYMDKQGMGIRNIVLSCREAGLEQPEFMETGDFLKVIIFFDSAGSSAEPGSMEEKIFKLLAAGGEMGRGEIQAAIGLSKTRTAAILKEMILSGRLVTSGRGNTLMYAVK